jgi:Ser/Thr protein kinase RdoA (MazF antagonist)
MEPDINARFNQEILLAIAGRYGITPKELTELDGFESFIYEFKQTGNMFILRISHSERRSEGLIRGEVDWINYLVKGGARASQVINSLDGNLVEMAADGQGEYFIGTVFEKAPGVPPWEFGWSGTLYQTYGKLLGRLHRLTKSYNPSDSLAHRPQWDDPIMLIEESWLPESEKPAFRKYQEVVETCCQLERTKEDYGLIHFDAHGANFFVAQDGKIHLFDFDDCHYNWFANDIAIVLFYMVIDQVDPVAFTGSFMTHFVQGYKQENHFKTEWLELIPLFLKMREIDLYAIIHRSYDVETMDDPWNLRYMKNRKNLIENDIPYLSFNFSRLAEYLK